MRVYFNILAFNFYQFIHYPSEILAALLNKSLTILFIIIFWQIILSEVGEEENLKYLLAYFMIAEGLADFAMIYRQRMGSYLRKCIKSGEITNHLIKPYKLIPAIYASVWGAGSITFIPSIIIFILGFILIAPQSLIGVLLFILFCVISLSLGFALNLFEGVLTFYIVQPSGILTAIGHITRLLSGSIIPLSFFPSAIKSVVLLLPFSMMIFTPISMLTITNVDSQVILTTILGLFWAISINLVVLYFWNRGLKQYEAIGL